jgi:hypothetical protein
VLPLPQIDANVTPLSPVTPVSADHDAVADVQLDEQTRIVPPVPAAQPCDLSGTEIVVRFAVHPPGKCVSFVHEPAPVEKSTVHT